MKNTGIMLCTVLLVLTATALAQGKRPNANTETQGAQKLTAADEEAVEQAILDEMYAHHLQGYVADIGKQESGPVYQLRAYFKPNLNSNRAGWVIYKLMPYGQVLRMFSLRSDGLAVLYGRLRDRFPPTQPSYLTVYMDDDQLCQFERDWSKEHFDVLLKPSTDRVAEALARQRKRNAP